VIEVRRKTSVQSASLATIVASRSTTTLHLSDSLRLSFRWMGEKFSYVFEIA
jgi:hypothetical protein